MIADAVEVHLGGCDTRVGTITSANGGLFVVGVNLGISEATNTLWDVAWTNVTTTIVTFGNVIFEYSPQGSYTEASLVNLNNFGTVSWIGNASQPQTQYFSLKGTFINSGTFIANAATVTLSTYDSWEGRVVTVNGGVFSFGSQSIDHTALCVNHEDTLIEVWRVTGRFGSHGYPGPYAWGRLFDESAILERRQSPHNDDARRIRALKNSREIKEAINVLKPLPCMKQYAFHGANNVVEGDGTGSVIFALPLFVEGDVEVRNGGRLYSVTEHFACPFFGGGRVAVAKRGELTLGIEANFATGGHLIVKRGGTLRVPMYATVQVTNFTMTIAKGATLRLEGLLDATSPLPHHNKQFTLCGKRKGRGSLRGEHQEGC